LNWDFVRSWEIRDFNWWNTGGSERGIYLEREECGYESRGVSCIVAFRGFLIDGLCLWSVARCMSLCGALMVILGRLDWLFERRCGSQAALLYHLLVVWLKNIYIYI